MREEHRHAEARRLTRGGCAIGPRLAGLSLRGLVLGMLLTSAGSCLAQPKSEVRNPPLSLEEGLRQGRALVAEILVQVPIENSTNTGMLKHRDVDDRQRTNLVQFAIFSTSTNWVSQYETLPSGTGKKVERLTVIHTGEGANEYWLEQTSASDGKLGPPIKLAGNQTMIPFAGSDFWVADLGLEFLHWPQQRVLRREMYRSQPCAVLESLNPTHGTSGYSRVVSWIDTENGAILHADAYEAGGAVLKRFDPTAIKKVHGQHHLEEMEMRNVKAETRTVIKFNL